MLVAVLGINPNNNLSVAWFRCRGQHKGREHSKNENPMSHKSLHGRFSLVAD
jgi:hypothetical protein